MFPKKKAAATPMAHMEETDKKPAKKGFSLFSRGKTEDVAIDFSTSLARATHNPLRAAVEEETKSPSNLRETLSAIEASFYVIDSVREIVVEACQLVLRASDIDDLAGRSLLAEQYDELRQSITQTLEEADEEASKLLANDAKALNAALGGQRVYTVDPAKLGISEDGLDLPPPSEAFASKSEIATVLGALDQAVARIDRISGYYMKDAQFLISRLDKQAGH